MKKQLASITLVSFAAQLAAFGKVWLVARYFGVGADLDGYNLAFVLPSLIAGVVSGAVQTGLFPVYAALRTSEGEEAVGRLERLLLLGIAGLTGSLSLLLLMSTQAVAPLLAQGASTAVIAATSYVLSFAAIAIVLNGVGDYLGFLLALRGSYAIAAAAPIVNALIGAALLAAWPQGGLLNLALGTILGLTVQVIIVLRAAQHSGFRLLGQLPTWHAARTDVREMLRLGGWILPGVVFSNLSVALPMLLIAPFGEGAVSAFSYAFRFHQSAVQLLVMAASPVILAHFSELVAQSEHGALRHLIRRGFGVSLLIGVVSFALVEFLGEALLLAVFGNGRFDAQAAQRVAAHWVWLAAALFPALWGNVLAKYILAIRRPLILSMLSFAGLLTLWVAAQTLDQFFGEYVIAASITISTCIVTLLMWSITKGGVVEFVAEKPRPRSV